VTDAEETETMLANPNRTARPGRLECLFGRCWFQRSRTAVYGPVRTVVWEGSAGDRRPYPDVVAFQTTCAPRSGARTSHHRYFSSNSTPLNRNNSTYSSSKVY